uniref:Uncharacterized protein n=1 Tax=Arundo donax TaxID=35708 RepID=A0A0A8ZSM7_ARUDO
MYVIYSPPEVTEAIMHSHYATKIIQQLRKIMHSVYFFLMME